MASHLEPRNESCSDASRRVDERKYGTGGYVQHWVLLEYVGPWGKNALRQAPFSEPVKERIKSLPDVLGPSRFYFIKRPRGERDGIEIIFAKSGERGGQLRRAKLQTYDDLLAIDFETWRDDLATAPMDAAKLICVCTDGRYDRCCAMRGRPVYRTLAALSSLEIWQSSHLGGDRFAANILTLPDGVLYGHVDPETVPELVRSIEDECLHLASLRGRCCYRAAEQAAEYFLRKRTGNNVLCAYELVRSSNRKEVTHVTFREASNGQLHFIGVRRITSSFENRMTCTAGRTQRVPQYELDSYRTSA